MKTIEATVEYGGAVIFVNNYSKKCFVPTNNVVKYSVVLTSGGYFWTLQLELTDKSTVCFGHYENDDAAFSDLRELLDTIYGEKKSETLFSS